MSNFFNASEASCINTAFHKVERAGNVARGIRTRLELATSAAIEWRKDFQPHYGCKSPQRSLFARLEVIRNFRDGYESHDNVLSDDAAAGRTLENLINSCVMYEAMAYIAGSYAASLSCEGRRRILEDGTIEAIRAAESACRDACERHRRMMEARDAAERIAA